jgi:hypothetical protein
LEILKSSVLERNLLKREILTVDFLSDYMYRKSKFEENKNILKRRNVLESERNYDTLTDEEIFALYCLYKYDSSHSGESLDKNENEEHKNDDYEYSYDSDSSDDDRDYSDSSSSCDD